MGIKQENLEATAIRAKNLSMLELALGEVTKAVEVAEQSVIYADLSNNPSHCMINRSAHAYALHQAGYRTEAKERFSEAETMSDYPLLSSVQGFRYCDLLLTKAEREAGKKEGKVNQEELLALCRDVYDRAAQTIKIGEDNRYLLDIALDHLTMGRAALYAAILESRNRPCKETPSSLPLPASEENLRSFKSATTKLNHAVSFFRRAGNMDELPYGLLTRAWLRSLTGPRTGPESAQSDLDEAWEIAERGPMPLFQADIHLYRARLFFREKPCPWESPLRDLAEARRLIFKHGHLRRKEELEDAESYILAV
jgi:hypothetical protein